MKFGLAAKYVEKTYTRRVLEANAGSVGIRDYAPGVWRPMKLIVLTAPLHVPVPRVFVSNEDLRDE